SIVVGGILSFDSKLHSRAADGSVRHVFHDRGIIAALPSGDTGPEPWLEVGRTPLDAGQRLLASRGLGVAVDRPVHSISPGSAAAFVGGVAGAGRNFDLSAGEFALAENHSDNGGILRRTPVALDDSQ